jgi:hypothetical protein
MVKLIACDLDGTLAESKSPISWDMGTVIGELLNTYDFCVITGGTLRQIRTQVVNHLPEYAPLGRLHLMPTCGTSYYRLAGDDLVQVYENLLPIEVRLDIIDAFEECGRSLGIWEELPYGPIIEDRGSQITYSALGQDAPLDKKMAWDPTGIKKDSLRMAMEEKFPSLEVRAGGSTSVDITSKGIDKAYGIKELSKATGIDIGEILFIGDRLGAGGNDHPVIATDALTYGVQSPEDTLQKLRELL